MQKTDTHTHTDKRIHMQKLVKVRLGPLPTSLMTAALAPHIVAV